MRVLPLATALLSVASAARNQTASRLPDDDSNAAEHEALWQHMRSYENKLAGHLARQSQHQRLAARATGQGYTPLNSQNNQCLDVKDGAFRNGGGVQLWQCAGNANQAWRIEGPLLQTGQDYCLDVPGGNGYSGASLQLWKCNGWNPNQHFEVVGNNIRWYGHNLCLDVKDGQFKNGQPLQLWACYFSSNNQGFIMGSPAKAVTPSTTQSGDCQGYPSISWTAFLNRHPVLAPYASAFPQAGAQYNLCPTLLGAIALQESSGNCAPNNGAGLMQFTDWNAWQQFGNGGNRENCYDAVWGGARYMRRLLDDNGQSLDRALRAYNGEIAWGGKPEYQSDIRRWMQGEYVYGPGT